MPPDGDIGTRRNDHGILLDNKATAAWQAAEEIWRAVSSRIVHTRLKLTSAGQRLPGDLHHSSDVFVSVVCVYAPTTCAPGYMVKHFYDELQDVLNSIPSNDFFADVRRLKCSCWGVG